MLASADDVSLRGRNVLTVADLSAQEIGTILALATHLKSSRTADQLPLLRGKTLGMLFEKPSLRTRVSFEVAMTQLGGHALFAHGSDFMVGAREIPEDVARTLSRFVNAILVRTHEHGPLERFDTLSGLRLAYVGDARNNVAHSLAEAAVMSGISVTFGCPPTHRPSEAFLGHLGELGKPTGSTTRAFTSVIRAVRDVDVVYTDVWTSMGEERLAERNAAALLPYRVTPELMAAAANHAVFMHCLPAHREEEVSAEVIDGPQSVVFDQAENRLHAQKAMLVALLTDLRGMPV
jgi:ornithine carbamoyltransferase